MKTGAKKIFSIIAVCLIVILLVTALAACGRNDNPPPPSGNDDTPPAVLTDAQMEEMFDLTLDANGYVISNYKGVAAKLNLPSAYKGQPIYAIGEEAFSACDFLTLVIIPDSVISIGEYAFSECSSLRTLTLGNSVQNIGECAFSSCFGLHTLTIPDSVIGIGEEAFAYCLGMYTLTIPDSVTSIGEDAFYGCYNLVHIRNLSAVDIDSPAAIGGEVVTTEDAEFQNKLEKDENGILTYTVGDMVYAIGYEGTDTNLDLSLNDKINAIYPYTFYYRQDFTSVTIPEGVKSMGEYAFNFCYGLQTLTIVNGVTSIGEDAFYGCYHLVHIRNLSAVDIDSPAAIDGEVVTTVDAEFQNKLEKDTNGIWTYTVGNTTYAIGYDGVNTNLDLSLNNKINAIYPWAFYECRDIISVNIPDGVTSIGEEAFAYCACLQSVTIGNDVINIDDEAFYYCTALREITIPVSVTGIGSYAFGDCSKLQTVYYEGTSEQWGGISISANVISYLDSATFYYFSEQDPYQNGTAEDGEKYWHWNADHTAPEVWVKQN